MDQEQILNPLMHNVLKWPTILGHYALKVKGQKQIH